MTIEAAAKLAKVGARTVSRWRQDPRFRQLVEEQRSAALERSVGVAGSLAVSALTTLDEIRRDVTAPPASRVSACRTMLETLLKSREASTLADRLTRLEEALQAGRPGTAMLPPAGGGFRR